MNASSTSKNKQAIERNVVTPQAKYLILVH